MNRYRRLAAIPPSTGAIAGKTMDILHLCTEYNAPIERASPTSVIPGRSASIRVRKMGDVEMSLITGCTTRACHGLLLPVIR